MQQSRGTSLVMVRISQISLLFSFLFHNTCVKNSESSITAKILSYDTCHYHYRSLYLNTKIKSDELSNLSQILIIY